MILVDSSGLLAALLPDQRWHSEALRCLNDEAGPLVLSPFVLAETDYLLARDGGQDLELLFLDQVAGGAFRLESFTPGQVRAARDVVADYPDLRLGLADASIVVLARHYGCSRLLTLDQRHFRTVPGPDDRPFVILPADL